MYVGASQPTGCPRLPDCGDAGEQCKLLRGTIDVVGSEFLELITPEAPAPVRPQAGAVALNSQADPALLVQVGSAGHEVHVCDRALRHLGPQNPAVGFVHDFESLPRESLPPFGREPREPGGRVVVHTDHQSAAPESACRGDRTCEELHQKPLSRSPAFASLRLLSPAERLQELRECPGDAVHRRERLIGRHRTEVVRCILPDHIHRHAPPSRELNLEDPPVLLIRSQFGDDGAVAPASEALVGPDEGGRSFAGELLLLHAVQVGESRLRQRGLHCDDDAPPRGVFPQGDVVEGREAPLSEQTQGIIPHGSPPCHHWLGYPTLLNFLNQLSATNQKSPSRGFF